MTRRIPTAIRLIALSLVAVALGAFVLTEPRSWKPLISARFPGGAWVDGATLSDWMEGAAERDLVLLDVRTPEEYAVSHLRRAQSVNAGNPELEALSIPPNATVVVYCSIGYRSAAIVEHLEEAGVGDVYNLEGGLFEWANQDRPLYRSDEQVRRVHPFNRWWGLLLRRDRRASNLDGGP